MSAVKYFIKQNSRKLAIDEFLASELNAAGYGGVEIRKMPMKTEVIVHASRPGVVIGRRGVKIRELTYILENEFGIENVQVEVSEIENPWLGWHTGFYEESCELGLQAVRLSLRVSSLAEEPDIRNSSRVPSLRLDNLLSCLLMKQMTEQFSNQEL